MIKICHLISQFETGGMENALVKLLNNFEGDFYHTILAVKSVDEKMKDKIKSKNVVILSYSDLGINSNKKTSFLKLSKFLRTERFDILHSRNMSLFLEGYLAQLFSNIRYIHSYHGVGAEQSNFYKKIYFFINNVLSAHRYCLYATLTNEMISEMSSLYNINNKDIDVLPNGVDTDKFIYNTGSNGGEFRVEIGIPASCVVIGSVSRFTTVKNVKHLVFLFQSLVANGNHNIYLLIVGDGPLMPEISGLVEELGLQDKVSLVGNVVNVYNYLSVMDIYTQFSISEGCSNSLLEAMACGLPCVVSNVGGNRDVLDSGVDGFLTNNSSPEEQVRLLEKLCLDDALRWKIGECARGKVVSFWSLPSMVKGYLSYYKKALK